MKKNPVSWLVLLPAVAAASLAGGCTTMTAAQLEAREYRRIDFEARYLDYRTQCLQAGKRIYIDAGGSLGRDGMPRPGDRFYCL